jgi:hypothetical protein
VPPLSITPYLNPSLEGAKPQLVFCLFVESSEFSKSPGGIVDLQQEGVTPGVLVDATGRSVLKFNFSSNSSFIDESSQGELFVECPSAPRDWQRRWELFVTFNGATSFRVFNFHGLANQLSGLPFTFDPCPAGTFTPSYAIPCMNCETGHFSSKPGQQECDRCLTGFFQPHTGSIACDECPVHTTTQQRFDWLSIPPQDSSKFLNLEDLIPVTGSISVDNCTCERGFFFNQLKSSLGECGQLCCGECIYF